MFLHGIFIVAYLLTAFLPDTMKCYLMIFHCLCIWYQYFQTRKKFDPLVAYSIYVTMASIANLAMIKNVATGEVSVYYSYIVPEYIGQSLTLWSIGNASLFAGFTLFSGISLPSISKLISEPKKLQTMYRVMLVLSFKFLYMGFLQFGSLGTIISVFSSVGTLFFARLWGYYETRQFKKYAITLFIIQTVAAILYSFLRLEMLIPTLALLAGYVLGKGGVKHLLTPKFIPIIFYLLFFNTYFNLYGNYRTQLGSGITRITALAKIAAKDEEVIYENKSEQNIFERSSILPQVSNVVNLTEQNGFYNGIALSPLLMALIPRFLWPEKPIVSLGSWFANEIGQSYEIDGRYTNSINMTIPGHLYLDFGLIGVGIGCFLFGGLLVLLWNSCEFYESVYNLSGVVFGGYILIISITGMAADLQISVTFFAYYLIFYLFKRFL